MSISIYKPNSKCAGCAFSFSIGYPNGDKPPSLYVNAIQQSSWDERKKTGSFSENKSDPDKNIFVKFNEFEIGSMISSFNTRIEYSTLHAHEDNKTQIKFTPWDKDEKVSSYDYKTKSFVEQKIKVPAFGINFTRNGNQTFRIPLTPGEVEVLKNFLIFALEKINQHRFDTRPSYDKKINTSSRQTHQPQAQNNSNQKPSEPSYIDTDFEEDAPF
jgi:hypothetical protein